MHCCHGNRVRKMSCCSKRQQHTCRSCKTEKVHGCRKSRSDHPRSSKMTSPLMVMGALNSTEYGLQGPRTTPASKDFFTISGLILIMCTLIGTSGNGLVVTVIARKGIPPTVTPIFIANLSSAHLLHCLLSMTMESAYLLLGLRWIFTDAVCKAVIYIDSVMSSAAILTLCAISIDRYYSVVYPLDRKLSLFKGTLMVTYTWTHSVIIGLPNLFATGQTRSGKCRDTWQNLQQAQIYLVVYTALTILCPLLLISVAYYLVWYGFRSSHRRVNIAKPSKHQKPSSATLTHASKTEMRLMQTLILMVSCFFILWAPRVVCTFLFYFMPAAVLSEYFILTAFWVSKIQPVIDPFIYGYLNKHFRKHLRELVRACSVQCFDEIGNDEIVTSEDMEYQGRSPAVSPLPPSPLPKQEENKPPLASSRRRHMSLVSNVYTGNAYTISFAAGTVDMQTVVEQKKSLSEAESNADSSILKSRHKKRKRFTKRLVTSKIGKNSVEPEPEKHLSSRLPTIEIDDTNHGQVLFRVNLADPVGLKPTTKELKQKRLEPKFGRDYHKTKTLELNPKAFLPLPMSCLPPIEKPRKENLLFPLPVPSTVTARPLSVAGVVTPEPQHKTSGKRKRRKILSQRLEKKRHQLENIMATSINAVPS